MRNLWWMALALLLGACGGGRAGQAAEACKKAIEEKNQGREIAVDVSAIAASAKDEGTDSMSAAVTVTIDPGLPRESKQTFGCTVRFTDSGADVISLSVTQ